jgi:hypothetical protein
VVALPDVDIVGRRGRLTGVEGIRVVADGVKEGTRPAARPVGRRDSADEPDRIMARRRRGDDVHADHGSVQEIPAAGEQRGVGVGRLRAWAPEGVGVGLVPDHHVSDLAVPEDHVADEAAVVLPRPRGARSVLCVPVDAQNDPHAASVRHEDAPDLMMVAPGQVATARSPRECDAHGVEPERVDGREDRLRL